MVSKEERWLELVSHLEKPVTDEYLRLRDIGVDPADALALALGTYGLEPEIGDYETIMKGEEIWEDIRKSSGN